MASLQEDKIAEVSEVFSLFDTVGDGNIAQSQIGDALRSLGLNPTQADVRKVSSELKDRVTIDVFLPILEGMSKRSDDTVHDFLEGFKVFDKDGNGLISAAELRHVLTTLGERLTDDEADQVLQGRENQQGEVRYEEFIKFVMSGELVN